MPALAAFVSAMMTTLEYPCTSITVPAPRYPPRYQIQTHVISTARLLALDSWRRLTTTFLVQTRSVAVRHLTLDPECGGQTCGPERGGQTCDLGPGVW
eukprot:2134072-Rhodomonas_salina.2